MGKGDAVTCRFGVLLLMADWAKLRFAVRTGLTRVKTAFLHSSMLFCGSVVGRASVQVTLNGDTLPS